ncbi:hypothetical protein BVC80_1313g51 [Macleaya cordata]|uniref:Uncharacterized protein n=1 Tax=Macleaya cordata TaxID=56857 RepID=A0A200QZ27_MACCD|nr:hypothetical protein BVC80_1313g51 [Macleaya cordata]
MAASLNILFAIVMLSLVGKGFCQCDLTNIKVSQVSTGKLIEGKAEYEVTVSNNCVCDQKSVTLNCVGFDTVEKVDPAIFRKVDGDDGHCILKNGEIFHQNDFVKFNYAWDTSFDLTPARSRIGCS